METVSARKKARRRIITAALISSACLSVALSPGHACALPSSSQVSSGAPATKAPVSLKVLEPRASEAVAAAGYDDAYLVEVQGSPSAGPTRNVEAVDRWTFVYNAPATDSSPASVVMVETTAGAIGNIIRFPDDIWIGSSAMDAIEMDPRVAGERLETSKFRGRTFTAVTLRRPNAASYEPHALYIFTFRHGYAAVDTVTGDVKQYQ